MTDQKRLFTMKVMSDKIRQRWENRRFQNGGKNQKVKIKSM